MNEYSQAVLRTIQYFDVQDHAVTLIEIHKYVLRISTNQQTLSLVAIQKILETDLQDMVSSGSGFFVLTNRTELISKRLQNNFYAVKRIKRARRYLPLVRFIPFIAGVALSGSEALSNSKQGSDIDLLVLTKSNRLWLGRIGISIFFQMIGMRRHTIYISDRFCLNHYVDLGKTINRDQNIYTAIEYVSLIPYFGGDAIYAFIKRNMSWISEYLVQPQIAKVTTMEGSVVAKAIEWMLKNPFGNMLELLAGKAQRKKIHLQEFIIVEDDELSFHPGSKGQQVLKKALG